ncbi:MAG: hypothetical protein ABI707_03430 [Ferruginibacter sp.]
MNPDNSSYRRKRLLVFSLILLATVGIASFLILTLWQNEDPTPAAKVEKTEQASVSPVHYNLIQADNELLTSRLNSLQQLDQQYAGLLPKSNDKKLYDSINQLIFLQEKVFRGSIDSIFLNTPNQADSGFTKLFNNIVDSYKSILENRRSMSSLRNAINLGKDSVTPDGMDLLKTQNELQEKNNRIASLESELKAMTQNKVNAVPQTVAAQNENTAVLKENIATQESKIATLTAAYYSLKQDNDRLLKQQNDAPKTAGTGELSFKTKTAALQQNIDELNAELRLAQVDCNLSRVDAGQIISNSRQRKELLSEASGILMSLAKSDDAEIRKKVQSKIVRLNQVAANSRD